MLKISNSTVLTYRSLTIDERNLAYREGTSLRAEKKFGYGEVSAVLLSPQNVLSIQIYEQIFKIDIQPDSPDHQHFIAMLLRYCQQTLPPGSMPAPLPQPGLPAQAVPPRSKPD